MTAVKWVVGKAFPVCVVDNSSNPLAGQECPHCDSMVRDFSCVPTLLFFGSRFVQAVDHGWAREIQVGNIHY